MSTLNIEELLKDIKEFSDERDWDQFHSPKNLSMALSVEASELLEIYQWMSEQDSKEAYLGTKAELIEEEIADIAIYLLRLVDKNKIDLEKVIKSKMRKNREKYPIALAKGSSKKYTEF